MKGEALGRAGAGTGPNRSRWRAHVPANYVGPGELKIDAKAPLFEPCITPRRVFEMREWSISEMRDRDEAGDVRSWWLVTCDVDDLASGDRREVVVTYSQAFRDEHVLGTVEALLLDARARMIEELTPLVGTHGWSCADRAVRIECF